MGVNRTGCPRNATARVRRQEGFVRSTKTEEPGMKHIGTLFVCAAMTWGTLASAVAVGDKVEALAFKDIRYVEHSLDTFKDKSIFVLYFTSSKSKQFEHDLPSLNELSAANSSLGVQVLIVNSGNDSILDMA